MKKSKIFLMGAIIIFTLIVGCSAESVEITIPYEMGYMTNDSAIIITAEQEIENDNGSVTYVMTKDNHSKLLDSVEDVIKVAVTKISTAEDFIGIFEEIELNDDYTTLTVKMNGAEVNQGYVFVLIPIMGMSTLYQQINSGENPSIKLTLVDAVTGKVIVDEMM